MAAAAASCPAALRGPWCCRQPRGTSEVSVAARPCLRRQQRRLAVAAAAGGGDTGGGSGELELPKPRKPAKLEPSYWLSREEAVEAQLKVCREPLASARAAPGH